MFGVAFKKFLLSNFRELTEEFGYVYGGFILLKNFYP
jgi:hypothetical protein